MLNIIYFYKLLGVQKSEKVVKIDYTGVEVKASIIEKSYISSIKETEKFDDPGALKMLPDELIKFFWALEYKEYRNKKCSHMQTNAFFGLFYTRLSRKTLDKINCTKQSLKFKKNELNELYEKASNYDIICRLDEVFYFYKEANNEEFRTKFKLLFEHQSFQYVKVDPKIILAILNGDKIT